MLAVTVGIRKLKITLSAEESYRFLGKIAKPCCKDPETRRFLAALLRSALHKTDFRLDCDRLYVEIYPSALGGHIIYFTKPPLIRRFHKNPSSNLTLMLEFKDFGDLISICKKLKSEGSSEIRSALYKYKGEYSLLITSSPSAFSYPLITEFADKVICSDIAVASVSEYGKLLIKDNAIDIISQEL